MKHFLVICAVLLGCCFQGMSAALEDDSKESDDTNRRHRDYNDNEGVGDRPRIMSDRNGKVETGRTRNWEGRNLDELMEDGNSNSNTCPNGWVHIQNSCYYFSSNKLVWNAAKAACDALGSKLAVVNSAAEQQALNPNVVKQGSWIGLHRNPSDKTRWLWVDGSQANYTHWDNGEPSSLDEECAEMRPGQSHNGKWNDLVCHNSLRYICEMNACPNGWVHIQSSCYYFSSNKLVWNAAKAACDALGSKLAVVNSAAEQQALNPNVVKQGSWIGLQRSPNDKTRWLWVDGSQANYTHWDNGEPSSLDEECAEMRPGQSHNGKWNDLVCHNSLRYICEINDVNECDNNSCQNGATCTNTIGGYNCTCAQGFNGKLCDQDVNECNNNPCQNGATCTNSKGSYQCVCAQGFQGKNCTKDINECDNRPCQNHGTCINTQGGYQCTCPPGFSGGDCEQDTNECDVSNGGCSHKCVNTAGGYKCECPDSELSLSSDNKTCHAPGVDVHCGSHNMTIVIPKSLLRGMDREHLRLLDTTCKATETSAHFLLTTPLTGCNTTSRHTPSAIVYSNAVLEVPVVAEDIVTRVREIEIQFSCFYSKYGVVSSVGWKSSNRKLVFSDEGRGNFTLSLNMFPDKRFVRPYMKWDFPVAVVLRALLFFEVSVTSDDKKLSIRADRCYATPTQDKINPLKFEFIKNGCPTDITVKYHSAPSDNAQRFSLEAFKFIADHPFVFVYCHVVICNATDPSSRCVKSCPSSGRGRREVNGRMTDDVYSLSQGPLHLAREKREETQNSGLGKSGSSPTLMMALFLMCVACLAGTALMAFKRSRYKPAGYTALASGDFK